MKETTKDLLYLALAVVVALATPYSWLAIAMVFVAGFWSAWWLVDAADDPAWQQRFERLIGDR